MILITIVITFILIFLSGVHWCAYKVDTIEERPRAWRYVIWSVLCGLLGVYNMISIVGLASK